MHDRLRRSARARRGAGSTWRSRMSELDPASPEYAQVAERFHRVRERIPRARRLRHRSAGGHGALRPGLSAARLEAAHRRVLRRLADAHRAGQTAARKAQPAAARRAHQPPRSGSAQLAGRLSARLSQRLRAGLARPLFSGRHGAQASPSCGTRACTSTPAATRATKSRRPSGARNLQAAYENQRTASSSWKPSSTASAYQATKAKQVQSRIKELEKIERIEIPPEEKTIHFRFPQPKPSGRIVAEFKNVAKSYGDHTGFRGRRTSSSSAATAWRWWASTARANRR